MASLKSNTYELREKLYDRQNKSRFSSINWNNPVNALGRTATGVISDLSQTFVDKNGGLVQGDINKVWRAKILLDRLGGPATGRTLGLSKDKADTGKSSIPNKMPNPKVKQPGGSPKPSQNDVLGKWWRSKLGKGELRPDEVDGERFEDLKKNYSDTHLTYTVKVSRTQDDRYELHDLGRNHHRNEIIIFNLNGKDENYQYIILQNRPPELEFQGETSWATIKSFGRNLPMYHFTGAEDKIQLQISWFCNDPDRPWEVVQKCRLLEAWSKSNGYVSGPPVLQIDWGGSGLFDNAYFILTSATYVLKQFRDGYMDRRSDNAVFKDGKLYPMAATQELVFSRVSSTNPLHSTIYDPTKLGGINGIGTSSRDQISKLANSTNNQSSLWQQV